MDMPIVKTKKRQKQPSDKLMVKAIQVAMNSKSSEEDVYLAIVAYGDARAKEGE